MKYKTDCYLVKREYELNKEKIEKAFNIILSIQYEENDKNPMSKTK
ncbi:hypothetical protein [Hathewaya massiliensis]|nr:hypothetical protein [Hathewaya massiliensis]